MRRVVGWEGVGDPSSPSRCGGQISLSLEPSRDLSVPFTPPLATAGHLSVTVGVMCFCAAVVAVEAINVVRLG